MLSQKIKILRKQAKLSQEQLAEKLNVSRQAVTKWETAAGVPDIENLRSLSALFHVSLDELLENQTAAPQRQDFLFDSVTEYDIDGEKSYDINLTGAKSVTLTGYDGEKLQVRLASNQISDIQSAFKVKIDDMKKRIDVDLRRVGEITETTAKAALNILIRIPRRYVKGIELTCNTGELTLQTIDLENLECSGKAAHVLIDGVAGHVELDSNEDLEIRCQDFSGRLDINQISALSRLTLPADAAFVAVTRGIANRILYQKQGRPADDFSRKGEEAEACPTVIELNGMKSELTISC